MSSEESVKPRVFFFLSKIGLRHLREHVDLNFLQCNYRLHTHTYVRTSMYVSHLDLAHEQGCPDRDEILPRFLRSHLGVLR